MSKFIFILGLFSILTGCSFVTSSGVEWVANGKYSITTNMRGIKVNGAENSPQTRRKAINEANAFCKNKGYRYANINDEYVEKGGSAMVTLYFNCSKKL